MSEPGRIIIPSMYTEASRFATVVAVGSETYEVQPGDVIMSNRYPKSAQPIVWQGEKLVTVLEEDILAIVRRNGQ